MAQPVFVISFTCIVGVCESGVWPHLCAEVSSLIEKGRAGAGCCRANVKLNILSWCRSYTKNNFCMKNPKNNALLQFTTIPVVRYRNDDPDNILAGVEFLAPKKRPNV